MILSLYCFQTNVLSKPENAGFKVEAEQVEKFLREFFVDGFNQGTAYLRVTNEACQTSEEDPKIKADSVAKELSLPEGHPSYGMNFLISSASALGIKRDFIEDIFKAIARIHFEEP